MAKPSGYSTLQITLHWVIAALVVFQILFHDAMEEVFDARMDGEMPAGGEVLGANLHAAFGLLILALALVRLVVRLRRGAPPVPENHPAPLRFLALVTHVLLYGFIILMPISGAVAWFGGIENAANAHGLMRFILIPLIGLHAVGALVEHFFMRTDVLKRMLRPQRG